MSTTSKVVLGIASTFTVGIVYYVHYSQKRDRERLHEGVLKDMERQSRKIHNIKALQDQIELTKMLTKKRDAESTDSGSSS